jgi:hypothetical protein
VQAGQRAGKGKNSHAAVIETVERPICRMKQVTGKVPEKKASCYLWDYQFFMSLQRGKEDD